MISIIVPTHNYGNVLGCCLKSILKNNRKLIQEIIIVDDASKDNTDQVIKKFKKNKIIRFYKCKFNNLAKTMNFAIKKTKSDFICKIDPDDEIKKNFLQLMNNFIKKKDFDFVFPDFEVFETIKKKKYIKSQKSNIFLNLIFYPHGSGCIFKKNIWKKVGGYNEKNYYQDDYDFWLKINKIKDIKIGHLQKPIYIYKKHKNNMSKNMLKKNFTKVKIFLKNII